MTGIIRTAEILLPLETSTYASPDELQNDPQNLEQQRAHSLEAQVALRSLQRLQEASAGSDVFAQQAAFTETLAVTRPEFRENARKAIACRAVASEIVRTLVAQFDPEQKRIELEQKIKQYDGWAQRTYGNDQLRFQSIADMARKELAELSSGRYEGKELPHRGGGHHALPEARAYPSIDALLMSTEHSLEEIGAILNVNPKTITRALKERGLDRAAHIGILNTKLPPPGENPLLDAILINKRIPVSEIAKITGVNERTIQREFKKRGLPPRNTGDARYLFPIGETPEADMLINDPGLSNAEVANRLGISEKTVWSERKRRAGTSPQQFSSGIEPLSEYLPDGRPRDTDERRDGMLDDLRNMNYSNESAQIIIDYKMGTLAEEDREKLEELQGKYSKDFKKLDDTWY